MKPTALVVLAACGDVAYYVPAGTRTPIERVGCADAHGDGMVIVAEMIVAERAGSVETTCRSGRVRIEARPATRIAITPITRPVMVGESLYLHADVLDADGHDLRTSDLTWSFDGLREGSACDHMLGNCVGHGSVHVIADAPGTARATAHFGAMSAVLEIAIRPR